MRYWVKLSVVGIPRHYGAAATEYMLEHLRVRRHLSGVRCVWRAAEGWAEFEAVVEAPNRDRATDLAHRDLIAVTSAATSTADESGYRSTPLVAEELTDTRH
jgi:hypothetical protein